MCCGLKECYTTANKPKHGRPPNLTAQAWRALIREVANLLTGQLCRLTTQSGLHRELIVKGKT